MNCFSINAIKLLHRTIRKSDNFHITGIYLQEVADQKKYLLSRSSYYEEVAAPDNYVS